MKVSYMMEEHYTIRENQQLTDHYIVDVVVRHVFSGGHGIAAIGPNTKNSNQWVALKTIYPDLQRIDKSLRDILANEALVWCGLWPHPNIIRAQFVTLIDGLLFLVLDYAQMGSLREVLQKKHSLEQRLIWAQHITAGLVALHDPSPVHMVNEPLVRHTPILHHDLKPENVLFQQGNDGIVYARITDFGLSQVLERSDFVTKGHHLDGDYGALSIGSVFYIPDQGGQVLGTPPYMPPEQWVGSEQVREAADVYALGLILSELLANRHALFDSIRGPRERWLYQQWLWDWREAHEHNRRRSLLEVEPSLPTFLEEIYEVSLDPNPANRPSAKELLSALQNTADLLGITVYNLPEFFPPTKENLVDYWQSWSDAFFYFGQYTFAKERVERAYELDPQNFKVQLTRADVLSALEEYGAALKAYDAILHVLPPDDVSRGNWVWSNRGVVLNKLKIYAEADDSYAKALDMEPGNTAVWRNRIINLWNYGHSLQDSGEVEEALKLWIVAQKAAEEHLKHDQFNNDILIGTLNVNVGILLFKKGQFSEAEASFESAIALQPEDAIAWYNRILNREVWGEQSLKDGRKDEALMHFRRAIEDAKIVLQLGLHQGEILPGPPRAGFVVRRGVLPIESLLVHISTVYISTDCYVDAEVACILALAAKPDFAPALVNLGTIMLFRGRLLARQGKPEAAQECWLKGVDYVRRALEFSFFSSQARLAMDELLVNLQQALQGNVDE